MKVQNVRVGNTLIEKGDDNKIRRTPIESVAIRPPGCLNKVHLNLMCFDYDAEVVVSTEKTRKIHDVANRP